MIVQYYKARVPNPADGRLAGSTEPTLAWAPIIYADHYLVYLSTDETEVAEGTVAAVQTNTNSYKATGLTTGTNLEDTGWKPYRLFDGMIDEVRIYDRALSADEVAFLSK